MVPETVLRTWNKEILNVFSDFSWYFGFKWYCLLAPMVPGTDVNRTGYRRLGTWYSPCSTVVHFTCHHPQNSVAFFV